MPYSDVLTMHLFRHPMHGSGLTGTVRRFGRSVIALTLLPAILLLPASASGKAAFALEIVSTMTRIFPDTPVHDQPGPVMELWSARNEYESVQLAIRPEKPLRIESVEIGDLVADGTGEVIDAKNCQARMPEFVYVEWHTRATPDSELDGVVPGWYPDPLETVTGRRLEKSNSIWLTCYIPPETEAGTYQGVLKIVTTAGTRQLAVRVHVWNFALPEDPTLYVSNWLHPKPLEKFYKVKIGTPEFWEVLNAVAADMASHRQNVIFTRLGIVKIYQHRDGSLSFDFSDYEKWVEIFRQHNINVIEGAPLFNRKAFNILDAASGKKIRFGIEQLATDKGKRLVRQFLRALHDKNRQLDIVSSYLQHVGDETKGKQVQLYREIRAIVREEMPGIPIIDATHLHESERDGMMDIAVTSLGKPVAKASTEWGRWWYTAGFKPRGNLPNRFIDYPLLKMRMIGWLSWWNRMDGFLHYGYNYWLLPGGKSPREQVHFSEKYAAGDPWIVYPRRDGALKSPVSSLRWELFRDGLEDYEYFRLLDDWQARLGSLEDAETPGQREKIKAVRSMLIALRRSINGLANYPRDPKVVAELRQASGNVLHDLSSYVVNDTGGMK